MIEVSCENVLPWIKPGWVGVEIGVCRGHSARRFLEHGVRFMYLVDPWCPYEGDGAYGMHAIEDLKLSAEFDLFYCLDRLKDYQSRYAILRMPSAEAERFIPMVDFVWVDGNHAYEYVRSDLEYYWPRVKAGGVLCGHDYTNNDTCQVARVVDEFAAVRSRRVELALPCWVIRKEEP